MRLRWVDIFDACYPVIWDYSAYLLGESVESLALMIGTSSFDCWSKLEEVKDEDNEEESFLLLFGSFGILMLLTNPISPDLTKKTESAGSP